MILSSLVFLTLSPVGTSPFYQAISQFYNHCGYYQPITTHETCILALDKQTIVGCCRLITEGNTLVLRGMHVAKALRRQGIGKQMLTHIQKAIEPHDCYCIPYAHLETFYGFIGFDKIAPTQAPLFLQQRLQQYQEKGLPCILMKKHETLT
jgi:N-acetylglutamate synthase-like GNAT family acetyltransferase